MDEQFTKGLVSISSDPPMDQKRAKGGKEGTAKRVKR